MISIIVPAYNAEKTITRCIKSIVEQSASDFELLLIDDGSTDGTGEICDRFAEIDNRVKVFHKTNGGVSSARNLGLDNAKGEWILFIDSDDYIEEASLEYYTQCLQSDLVIASMRYIYNGACSDMFFQENSYCTSDGSLKKFIEGNLQTGIFSSVWSKFFRHELIAGQRFNTDYKIGEDSVFMLQYLNKVKSCHSSGKLLYIYQYAEGYDLKRKYRQSIGMSVRTMADIFSLYFSLGARNKDFERCIFMDYKNLCQTEIYDNPSGWYKDASVKDIYRKIKTSFNLEYRLRYAVLSMFRQNMSTPMDIKHIFKSVIPSGLWAEIRKQIILSRHRKVVSLVTPIVNDCLSGKLDPPMIVRQKDLPGEKIIWQYWAQGFDDKEMPELIHICLKSVDRYAQGYKVIRLSDRNLSEYIQLPDYILRKKGTMSKAHFSDILRCALLSTYGGLWLDVSVLLTGELPEYLFCSNFFMYQRNPKESEPDKRYWENSFANYWGWYKGFRVNIMNGILHAENSGIGHKVITDLYAMLAAFWERNDKAPDYFFFQIMADIYKRGCKDWKCPVVSDCIPHMLRQVINNENAPWSAEEAMSTTSVHSLNYKNRAAADRLKTILKEYNA